NRLLVKYDMLCVQQMVWRDLQVHQQLNVTQISRRKQKIQIFPMVDQQNLPIEAKFGESSRERLGFMVLQIERVDDIQLILFQLQRQSGFQSGAEHLLRQVIFVIARPGTKYGAALTPQWIADFPTPRAACALLPPRFLPAALHLSPRFRVLVNGPPD